MLISGAPHGYILHHHVLLAGYRCLYNIRTGLYGEIRGRHTSGNMEWIMPGWAAVFCIGPAEPTACGVVARSFVGVKFTKRYG